MRPFHGDQPVAREASEPLDEPGQARFARVDLTGAEDSTLRVNGGAEVRACVAVDPNDNHPRSPCGWLDWEGWPRTFLSFGDHAAIKSLGHPQEPRGLALTRSEPRGPTERFRVTLDPSGSFAARASLSLVPVRSGTHRKIPSTSVRRLTSLFKRS